MIKKILKVSLLSVLLQGCTNLYSEFYYESDAIKGVDVTKLPFVILPTEEPQVFRGNIEEQDSLNMAEHNYNSLGYSSFNAADIDENSVIDQAKKVHAEIVLLYAKHTGTVSGNIPLTLPNTTTSSTSLNGSAYGSAGYTSYSGVANTTTYGTKTTYIPYSIDRSDYLATYWIKIQPRRFGAIVVELTSEIKQQIGSNKGVLVYAVVKDSPAFKSDIINKDVIKKIGDVLIVDVDSYRKAIDKYEGKEADVALIRGDKELHKSVKLGNSTSRPPM